MKILDEIIEAAELIAEVERLQALLYAMERVDPGPNGLGPDLLVFALEEQGKRLEMYHENQRLRKALKIACATLGMTGHCTSAIRVSACIEIERILGDEATDFGESQ